jgi:hypothetical protein
VTLKARRRCSPLTLDLLCTWIYTIAHHVFTEDGVRKMMIAWLPYLDAYVKIDGAWYFAERELLLEWSETRALGVPTA